MMNGLIVGYEFLSNYFGTEVGIGEKRVHGFSFYDKEFDRTFTSYTKDIEEIVEDREAGDWFFSLQEKKETYHIKFSNVQRLKYRTPTLEEYNKYILENGIGEEITQEGLEKEKLRVEKEIDEKIKQMFEMDREEKEEKEEKMKKNKFWYKFFN